MEMVSFLPRGRPDSNMTIFSVTLILTDFQTISDKAANYSEIRIQQLYILMLREAVKVESMPQAEARTLFLLFS